MVTIAESNVVSAVRINLDEIAVNDANFSSGQDEVELETIIKSKMNEAYRYVMSNAKAELIDANIVSIEAATFVTNTKTAKVSLTDLLRFVWASDPDWKFPVFQPIYWNTTEYATLFSPKTTGTSDRPKVGICPSYSSDGTKAMDVTLYGVQNNGVVAYIKDVSTSVGAKLTETLYSAYLYYITALVLLTLRESNHAEEMVGQALALMGIDTSKNAK